MLLFMAVILMDSIIDTDAESVKRGVIFGKSVRYAFGWAVMG